MGNKNRFNRFLVGAFSMIVNSSRTFVSSFTLQLLHFDKYCQHNWQTTDSSYHALNLNLLNLFNTIPLQVSQKKVCIILILDVTFCVLRYSSLPAHMGCILSLFALWELKIDLSARCQTDQNMFGEGKIWKIHYAITCR